MTVSQVDYCFIKVINIQNERSHQNIFFPNESIELCRLPNIIKVQSKLFVMTSKTVRYLTRIASHMKFRLQRVCMCPQGTVFEFPTLDPKEKP